MLKTLKESVEKLPRSGFVHLLNIIRSVVLYISTQLRYAVIQMLHYMKSINYYFRMR